MTGDYLRLGMTYDPTARRIDRLEEAIPLIKRLLTGETVTHHGYRLDGASTGVQPIQKPRPPLAIGGDGPRMLKLAVREAEIVGLVPGFDANGRPHYRQATETATAEKVDLIRMSAGDRFERLEINNWLVDAALVGSGNSLLGSVTAAARWVRPSSTAARTCCTARSGRPVTSSYGAVTGSGSATTRCRATPWSRWRR